MKVWARSSAEGKSARTGADAVGRAPAELPGVPSATRAALDDALIELRALRWRYTLAQAEIEGLRNALSSTEDARDKQDQRRSALIEAVADSVPSAMLTSRRQGWDEGWEAARAGFPKSVNPHRERIGPPAAD